MVVLTGTAVHVSGQIGTGQHGPVVADSPKDTERPQANPKSSPPGPGVTPGFNRGGPLTIPMMSNDHIIAVTPKDGRSVTAMVIGFDRWQEYRAPAGVQLRPILSEGVLAPTFSGDEVRELAAFSISSLSVASRNVRGTWVRQQLRQPAKGDIVPSVLPEFAYYQIGSDVYAFSATTNGWDTLHLEGTEPKVVWTRTALIVEQDETLYVFSVAGGNWSKGLKVPSVTAK